MQPQSSEVVLRDGISRTTGNIGPKSVAASGAPTPAAYCGLSILTQATPWHPMRWASWKSNLANSAPVRPGSEPQTLLVSTMTDFSSSSGAPTKRSYGVASRFTPTTYGPHWNVILVYEGRPSWAPKTHGWVQYPWP